MKIDLEKLCSDLLEEKRKKRKKKIKKSKRSSKRYGWGFIGYGYPGVYGDVGGTDGAGGGE